MDDQLNLVKTDARLGNLSQKLEALSKAVKFWGVVAQFLLKKYYRQISPKEVNFRLNLKKWYFKSF